MKNFQNKAKIVKVSKILRSVLFVGLIFWGICILSSLIGVFVPFILSKYLHWLDSLVIFRACVMLIFCFVINLNFFRFVDRLKDAKLFDLQTVGYLELAGKWWLGLWLFMVMTTIIFSRIYPDTKYSISDICDFSDLFAGLFVVFIAWLFREAQELQEEQELTV